MVVLVWDYNGIQLLHTDMKMQGVNWTYENHACVLNQLEETVNGIIVNYLALL